MRYGVHHFGHNEYEVIETFKVDVLLFTQVPKRIWGVSLCVLLINLFVIVYQIGSSYWDLK